MMSSTNWCGKPITSGRVSTFKNLLFRYETVISFEYRENNKIKATRKLEISGIVSDAVNLFRDYQPLPQGGDMIFCHKPKLDYRLQKFS